MDKEEEEDDKKIEYDENKLNFFLNYYYTQLINYCSLDHSSNISNY